MNFSECIVSIVGMGLMGGSLGMALVHADLCKEVRGVVRKESQAEGVLKARAAHFGGTAREGLIEDADVVILATPVCTIEKDLLSIGPVLKPGAVLTDLGSTKTHIVNTMNKLGENIVSVGGHPMCGKETSGLDAATPSLFERAVWALTPTKGTTPDGLALLEEMITAIGANPTVVDAEEHDAAVATVSTLPCLFAAALMTTTSDLGQKNELIRVLASSGLRDTSRLAGSNIPMMMDIIKSNRDHVARVLSLSLGYLGLLDGLLEKDELSGLDHFLRRAKEERSRLFPQAGTSPMREQESLS